jgi:hypothetical protein
VTIPVGSIGYLLICKTLSKIKVDPDCHDFQMQGGSAKNKIDDHQHDHRYTEEPPKNIFAHRNSPFLNEGIDENALKVVRPVLRSASHESTPTDESFVRPVVLPVSTADTGMLVACLKVLIFGANLICL